MLKVSLILPVYNGEKYIGRCVDSILSQSFCDWELIIVDDGSFDATAAICDEYARKEPRIRIHHKKNGGVSAARNTGISIAKGDWIGFVDADDWLSPDALETIAENINSDSSDILCFGFHSVTKDEVGIITLCDTCKGKTHFMREQMLHGWTVVWNTCFRKSFLNEYGLWFNEEISIGEDFELLFRAYYYARNIVVVNKPLYYYNCTNEESALHRITVRHYDEIIGANLSVAQFYNDKGVIDEFRDIVSWKILRAKQDYVLDIKTHDKFLSIYPECHKYILNCPTLNTKMKIMMWFLIHRMGWMTRLLVGLRNSIINSK